MAMKSNVKIMVINHVDVDTILGKAVHVKLIGDAPAFHFKTTGTTISTELNGDTQIFINGYDSESLELSIDVKDIKHIYGG